MGQGNRILEIVLRSSPRALALVDAGLEVVAGSNRFWELHGMGEGDVYGHLLHLMPAAKAAAAPVFEDVRSGSYPKGEARWRGDRGAIVWSIVPCTSDTLQGFLVNAVPGDEGAGASLTADEIATVNEKVRASEEIARAQEAEKMEAIVRLAGGVAHDFNNILAAVMSYGHLVLETLAPGDERREDMLEILSAAETAEDITGKLLAYARRTPVSPRPVDINDFLEGHSKILGALVGDQVRCQVVPAPDLWSVEADPGALEQVVVNLTVNARNAMPDGGALVIKTSNVFLDSSVGFPRGERVKPGSYVMLSFSDDGVGIPRQALDCIFEPFFSTKSAGRGRGLGLALCHGLVKQMSGYVRVKSEVGQGSSFEVFVPRGFDSLDSDGEGADTEGDMKTVLVVEDDAALLRAATRVLRRSGYRVLTASDADEAIAQVSGVEEEFDLLLTDVVMPRRGGAELASELRQRRPDLKVLFMSGYTKNSIDEDGKLPHGVRLLTKPFTPGQLLSAVREMFDLGEPEQ